MDNPRDVLAAKYFPDAWAKARTGRRRTQLRKMGEQQDLMARLKTDRSACCSNCNSFDKYPHGKGHICKMDSDFHGYAMTTADSLCPKWTPKEGE